MGASKKLMEELIMSYSGKLKITTARFANVAFSNGSLPLGFIERLSKRQPWSCPLGIRRFFVSPQESGELCMIASVLGESGDIIFPKLDEERDMISFDAIARDLLKYLGMEADVCKTEEEARQKMLLLNDKSTGYPVYFFETDTSGEKPYEEFFTDREVIDDDRFINLGVIKNSVKRDFREIDDIFTRLRQLFDSENVSKASIVDILKTWLPDFDHIEKGKGLDSKM
jgi:FlaA1/EpsC-like NDP-sugar epimerase